MSTHGSMADNKIPAVITPETLYRFLTDAPVIYSKQLTDSDKRLILTNCYRALWCNNPVWMQKYFFKEDVSDAKNLSKLLEKYNLFGSNDDTSEIVASNPGNALVHPSEDEPEYWESQRGKQCGHLFKKGESIYRCKNCGLDNTCVLCSHCFHSTNHEGHDIKINISQGSGGCCDCGDPEAWKTPLECTIHSTNVSGSSAKDGSSSGPVKDKENVDPLLLKSIKQTLEVVLDYILETFATSPEDVSPGKKENIMRDCRDSHKAHHIPYNPTNTSYVCMLWNDEHHSFDEVINIVSTAINCSKEDAMNVAEEVDAYGRNLVFSSDNLDEVISVANVIHGIKLAVTIRSVQTTIREEISGLLLNWLKDLISGRYKFFGSVQGGNVILRDIICEVLSDEWSLSPDLAALSTRSRRGRMAEEEDTFTVNGSDGGEDFGDDFGEDFGDELNDGDDAEFIVTEGFGMMEYDDEDEFEEAMLSDSDIEEIVAHQGSDSPTDSEGEEEDTTMSRPHVEDDVEMSSVYLTPESSSQHNQEHGVSDEHRQQPTSSQEDQSRDRHENTPGGSKDSSKQKQPHDIIDLDWDIDAWLSQTVKFGEEERSIAADMGVPVTAPKTVMEEANVLLKKEFKRKVRLDYILQFDLRLWKSARESIKELLLGTLISNFDYRRVMGIRFSRNYPELVDAFFFKDREPGHSASTLSVQLLTVPSIAALLVKDYRFFEMVCSILSGFFLTNHVHVIVPDEYRDMQVNCLTRAMTRHRYACTFFDLRYVLNADPVKIEVCHNPIYLRYFLDMIYQFQAMDPLEHQEDFHVEFESTSWANAFNATLQISKLCRQFSDCFNALNNNPKIDLIEGSRDLCRSVYRVLKALEDWSPRLASEVVEDKEKHERMLIKGIKKQKYHTISMAHAGSYEIVDYNVLKKPVSFHHPYHWLLSELLEHIFLFQDELLSKAGWNGGFKQMIKSAFKNPSHDIFLTILDYPLRTMVVLAQINCGVWVRNGFSVRDLARTYRDISVRENTYDKDIYLLQVGFVATDPNQFLITMLDRFNILDWFIGKPKNYIKGYDASSVSYMVEEFLNLLIICVTERSYPSGETTEDKIRRAIIQHLGISNMAHSELIRLMPESLSEDEGFDVQLGLLANYKPPDGLNDYGMFELKEEFCSEINPYYWHYTRNHREEAIEVIKKQIRKGAPSVKIDGKEEVIVMPKFKKINSGPFKYLGDFLHSRVLCQIVLYSLWNTKMSDQTKSESILDSALYLAMTALVDENSLYYEQRNASRKGKFPETQSLARGFIENATSDKYPIQTSDIEREQATLLKVLLKCLDDSNLSNIHKRCLFIVERIESETNEEDVKETIREWKGKSLFSASLEAQQGTDDGKSEYERKKAAAKARQEAIMNQFAQAQSKFMEQHIDLYDGEEDDSEGEKYNEDDTSMAQATQNIHGEAEIERVSHFPSGTCIVCQEDLDRSRLYGMLGLVQKSRILRQTPLKNVEVLIDVLEATQDDNAIHGDSKTSTEASGQGKSTLRGFPSDAQVPGLHISTCGHLMHAECFLNYQSSVNNEAQNLFLNLIPEAMIKKQFLCPLCKALGNTLLPIVWKGKKEIFPGVISPRTSYGENIVQTLEETLEEFKKATDPDMTAHIPGAFVNTERDTFVNQDSSMTITDTSILKPLYTQLMKTVENTDRIHEKRRTLPSIQIRNLMPNNQAQMLIPLPLPYSEARASRSRSESPTHPLSPPPPSSELPMTPIKTPNGQLYNMYAYTISAIEIQQRGVDRSRSKDLTIEHTNTFLDGISSHSHSVLRLLAKTTDLLPRIMDSREDKKEKRSMKHLGIQDLQNLIGAKDTTAHLPLLCEDIFTVLVRLGFTTHETEIEPHHLVRLLFLAELSKITIALMQDLTGSDELENPRVQTLLKDKASPEFSDLSSDDEAYVAHRFANGLMELLGVPPEFVQKFFLQISPKTYLALLRTFTLPFLRKTLLLMVVHFGLILQNTVDEDPQETNGQQSSADEYNRLIEILRLPQLKEIMSLEPFEEKLVKGWCDAYSVYSVGVADPILTSQTPVYSQLVNLSLNLPIKFSIVSLPYRIDQLFEESLRRVCRKCKSLPEYPALCLVCGTFVCARRICCTEGDIGECNTHMRSCSGEVGIYMVVKECFILLLHDNGGTVMSAPYLDSHGEADLFLRRGTPQYLNEKRYEQIRQMWLSHSIPAFVRRRMEVSNSYTRWESW
ncbi:hypothetical protein CLU79DRAFT_753863 [Phycomyces nitens]|nr:hypothetical protein CLU79DRAFT_753863 [Phycomyces nitens]